MKKICVFIIVFGFLFSTFVFASDGESIDVIENKAEVTVTAKSAVLIDGSTGKVLFKKNPNEKMPMASITKIMTMLLVMEAIEANTIKMSDMVTTTAHAASMGGTQIWLEEGEQMSVHDLMKSTAVASANDASMALAEHIGGSEQGFVAMMNNKATELGMENTVFVNPTGLDAQGHYSTALDIAIMSKALLEKKGITEYTTIWMDNVRDGKNELVNTNKLVRFYKGATGLKTGTTNGAGSCVSATATRNDMNLVSVVMGCDTSKERFDDARRLLDYGFSSFVIYKTSISKNTLKPVKVNNGVKENVLVDTNVIDSLSVPKGKEKSIKEDINIQENIQAPIFKGQKIGEIVLKIDDEVVAKFEIKASESVEKMTFGNALKMLMNRLCSL